MDPIRKYSDPKCNQTIASTYPIRFTHSFRSSYGRHCRWSKSIAHESPSATPEQHHQVIDMFVRDGHVALEAQGFYPGISQTPRNDPTNLERSRDADRSIHTGCAMYSELSHRGDEPKLNTRTKNSQKAFLPKQPEHIPQTR